MKILLIYPRTKHIRIPPPSWVPLGLSFMASVLEQRGHTVSIFDRAASQARLGLDKQKVNAAMMEEVRRFNPDLIGLNTVSPLIYDTMECVALLRRQHSGPIVAGGHHASALPELTLQKIKGLTGAVQGEGEPALLALADGQSPSRIPGLWWRNGDSISHNPPQQISNLDNLPFPAYHLLDMSFYTRSNVLTFRGRYLSSISMLTSRGCPKMCSFCSESSTYGRGVRFHSPEYVVDWVRSTLNEYPIQGIYFHDNDFLIDRQRAIEICNDFIRHGFNKRLRWAIQARSDNIDLDILELLKQAGCSLIEIGVETSVQEELNSINKMNTTYKNEAAIKMCRKVGIAVHSYMLSSLAGETLDNLKQNIDWLQEIKSDTVSVHDLALYPGTRLYQEHGQMFFEKNEWSEENIISFYNSRNLSTISEDERRYWMRKHYLPYNRRRRWLAILRSNSPVSLVSLVYDDIKRLHLQHRTK